MLTTMITPAGAEPGLSPAQELLAAASIDENLAELLLMDVTGHPFEPVALALSDEPAALAEQMALLTRAEPVGGAEPLVRANQRRIGELFRQRLHQRLLTRGRAVTSHTLLAELQAELRRLRDHASLQSDEADEEYELVQRSLRAWQIATRDQPGLLRGLAGWLFGTSSQIALPQAVALWNDRERLALARLAAGAGATLLSQLTEELGRLVDNQQAAAGTARTLACRLREDLAELSRAPDGYGPWAWRGDVGALAARLADQADHDLLAERLAETLSGPSAPDGLETSARALAEAAADRLLVGMSFTQLVEAEAAGEELDGADGLLLLGRRLLSLVDQRPSWRLARGARPRVETMQITADGAPVFRLEDLQTAAFGGPDDRLGCMQVELEVSSDELALLRDSDGAFAAALALRNFYVLDELAAAWEQPPAAPEGSPAANGAAPGDPRQYGADALGQAGQRG